MKTLVTYYSRTGNTEKVGQDIAARAQADLEPIKDSKKRGGIIGWLKLGMEARREKKTQIEFSNDPQRYELIIVGTPINAGKMAPAVRTFLVENELDGKQVAFFVTSKGGDATDVFEDMDKLTANSKLLETLSILAEEVETDSYRDKVGEFLKTIGEIEGENTR